jgi:hypothetical protein
VVNNKLTRSDSFSNQLTSRAGLNPTGSGVSVFDREGGKGKGGSVKTSILRSLKPVHPTRDVESLLNITRRGADTKNVDRRFIENISSTVSTLYNKKRLDVPISEKIGLSLGNIGSTGGLPAKETFSGEGKLWSNIPVVGAKLKINF